MSIQLGCAMYTNLTFCGYSTGVQTESAPYQLCEGIIQTYGGDHN